MKNRHSTLLCTLLIIAWQVILATGGLSYPLTGSTGDGYRLAQRLADILRC